MYEENEIALVQNPSQGKMQGDINAANREPEDEEDHAADHGQDVPWWALVQAQVLRGGWRAACRYPLTNLENALLVRHASVGLRIGASNARPCVGGVKGDSRASAIARKDTDEGGVVALGPVVDLSASDGDAEVVGIGGGRLGVDGTYVFFENVHDLTWVRRAH